VIRKDRAKILREQGLRNLEKFSLQQLNLQSEVIIESDDIARTDNFLQVKLGSHDLSAGSLAKISINQYSDHCLHGVVINGMVQ
jgi:threonylcarbamoyladenosine tRNA methylthiotransferase MtaB